MDLTFEDLLKDGINKNYFKVQDNKIFYIAQDFSDDIDDPEEKVRIGLFYDLIEKYGYKNDKNIIDLEFNRVIGHPYKRNSSRLDIIIYREDHTPFAIIELKSEDDYDKYFEDSIKTQLFERAANEDKGKNVLKYLIYYTRYYEDGELKEKYETIDYEQYKDWDEWEKAGRPNLRIIPKTYDIINRPPQFIKGSTTRENQLREDVKKNELTRISDDLHNVLWGGGRHQNELFFNLISLFLTKIYDEKTTPVGKPYQFQIFYEGSKEESPDKIYNRINKLFRGEKTDTGEYTQCALNYLIGYNKEMLDKQTDIVFDANKVKYVVELIQDISFTSNKYDVLGDFFEKIVRREIKETKGQFLTHYNIVSFIVKAIQVEELSIELLNGKDGRPRLPYIIDPSCGSGTFLIRCMKAITDRIRHEYKNGNKISKSDDTLEAIDDYFLGRNKNKWAKDFIYGIEINNDLAMATKVNMVGHGDGSANIFAEDGLIDFEKYRKGKLLNIKKKNHVYEKFVNEQFDVVISNPPFSITVDKETAKQLPNLFLQGKRIEKSLKSIQKKEVDTELLFLERYYQLLRPNGRLGVVLPESVFDSTSNRDIRLFLFKYFKIKAVISLPHIAFSPYTMTKTSLLFAQKKTEDEVKTWDRMWNQYSKEFDKINKEINKLKNRKESEELKPIFIEYLKKYLRNWYEEKDDSITVSELKNKYNEEIKSVDKEWWVFSKVSEDLNYSIFMAHAEEIGYKRGANKEDDQRPNELFAFNESNYDIIINKDSPERVIDYLYRDVVWE